MPRVSVEELLRVRAESDEEVGRALGLPSVLGVERFVLEHGREYEPQRRPRGIRRRKAGACFRNAYLLAEGRGLVYVEGFAARPPVLSFLIHHAWCLDETGKVVDATWEEPEQCSYFGIPFRFEFVERVTMRNRYYGGVLMPWEIFDPRAFEGVEFRHAGC